MPEDQFSSVRISIPGQGIDVDLTREELLEFVDEEIKFYTRLRELTDRTFQVGQVGYGNITLAQNAIEILNAIKSAVSSNSKLEQLNEYIESARRFRVLVGQGTLGRKVETLIKQGELSEAKWVVYIMSPAWLDIAHPNAQEVLSSYRAAFTANPAVYAFTDLLSTKAAAEQSESAARLSHQTAEQIESFRNEKAALFDSLEELYREKLVLDEPALLWTTIAESKRNAWRLWLLIFAALILIPLILLAEKYDHIVEIISKLATTANGGISISGLAAITAPALFYAWLLKNVSRIFLQNLSLADDAAHRRALALTFLGLAANPKLSVSEQDRALILNALFRPTPNNNSDDGPPAGILDLIRKKDQ